MKENCIICVISVDGMLENFELKIPIDYRNSKESI